VSLDPSYSPDGLWFWNGMQWVPTAPLALAGGPPGAGATATFLNAGFGLRLVAWFIDLIALWIGGVLVNAVLTILGSAVDYAAGTNGTITWIATGLSFLFQVVGGWLYFSLLESSKWQATLGKRAMGIMVVDYGYNRISFGKATGRYWGKVVSTLICYIGFFMAGWTERKQALHDIMASTLVIRRDPVYAYAGQSLPAPAPGSTGGSGTGGRGTRPHRDPAPAACRASRHRSGRHCGAR